MGVISRIGRVLQVTMENFIVQTVESRFNFNNVAKQYAPSGDDSPPMNDDRVVLVKVDGAGKFVSCGVLSVSQGAKQGEKILYGRDADGVPVAFLKLLGDGSVVVEGEGDVSLASAGNMALGCDGDMSLDGASINMNGGSMGAARNGDSVQIEIPIGSVIVSVTGGAGAPAVGKPNTAPIVCTGKITKGSGSVKVGD